MIFKVTFVDGSVETCIRAALQKLDVSQSKTFARASLSKCSQWD